MNRINGHIRGSEEGAHTSHPSGIFNAAGDSAAADERANRLEKGSPQNSGAGPLTCSGRSDLPAPLMLLGNNLLRTAITLNLVTFPAQIQPFMKRTSGDLHERIVQLYFVRGWTVRSICERYSMSKAMVHKILAEWRVRAIESGYIQEIEPGCLSSLEPETNRAGRLAGHGSSAGASLATPESAPAVFTGPLRTSIVPAGHTGLPARST